MKVRHWVEFPYMRLRNSLNSRANWRRTWREGKQQKTAAFMSVRFQTLPPVYAALVACKRWKVTITRRGPQEMDDDNLAGVCKWFRDGVAKALGVDDKSKRYRWKYEQEKTTKAQGYSVLLEIEGF